MKTADRNVKGIVFNIQKFSVNDGPGIRTVVFFKGCPLRCGWCSNPESQAVRPQVLHDPKKCVSCLCCLHACPQKAIYVEDGNVLIDQKLCNGCGRCVPVCMQRALESEGREYTVQEVLDEVLQDLPFYEESGGGLTLSGGEFFLQPEFAENLLLAAKEEGLHTCCETTGFVKEETFDRIIPLIDHVFMDMKHWNSAGHVRGTGVPSELIMCNMQKAVEMGKTILPRIPVIPGYNDSIEDAKGFAELLKKTGLKRVQLLPFHQFGENKYHLLNQKYAYEDVPSLHPEDLTAFRDAFLAEGIDAFF